MAAFFYDQGRILPEQLHPYVSLRRRASRVMLLVAVLVLGCNRPEPPDVAFNRLAAAAEAGDMDTFLTGFTEPSRALLDGVMAVSGGRSGAFAIGSFSQGVQAVQYSEQADDFALVLVQSGDTPPEVAQLVMRLDDGAWRVDLISTELLWNRSWELSGRERRGDGMSLDFGALDTLGSGR